jgi:hypothetical protein
LAKPSHSIWVLANTMAWSMPASRSQWSSSLRLWLALSAQNKTCLMLACFSCGLSIVDALGFAHHAGGQLLDAGSEGGAEHHGLLALMVSWLTSARSSEKPRSSMRSASSTTRNCTCVEFDLHGALQVQQTARGSDHQIGVLQLGNLQLVGHATHDVGNAQAAAMLHQIDGVVRHLLSQFAGRAQRPTRRAWRP